MIRLKKLVIIAVLVLGLVLPSGAARAVRDINNFTDIGQSDWYYPYVKRLYDDGLINGVSESMFAPGQTVKMSEAAAMIVRYLGHENTAVLRRARLAGDNIEGHGLWYSGYIQVLRELYIIDDAYLDKYGIRINGRGQVFISSESAELIDAPIKRMDVVKMIASSFEIRESAGLRTRGLLPAEISGRGGEFITGGGYDKDLLDWIAENRVSDYDDIAWGYRTQFLKLVYNGIISGNERRQVLPENYLTRAELARIIASVIYFDLRDADLRELPEACVISAGDYAVSSVDGSRILKSGKAELILREQAKNISARVLADGRINIDIEQKNIIPAGFINEIYIYVYDGRTAVDAGRMNGASADGGEYLPRTASFRISGRASPAGYIYLILRDVSRGGEVAGVWALNISPDGRLSEAPVYNLP